GYPSPPDRRAARQAGRAASRPEFRGRTFYPGFAASAPVPSPPAGTVTHRQPEPTISRLMEESGRTALNSSPRGEQRMKLQSCWKAPVSLALALLCAVAGHTQPTRVMRGIPTPSVRPGGLDVFPSPDGARSLSQASAPTDPTTAGVAQTFLGWNGATETPDGF